MRTVKTAPGATKASIAHSSRRPRTRIRPTGTGSYAEDWGTPGPKRKKLELFPISAVTGVGIDDLKWAMAERVEKLRRVRD